MEVDAPPAPRSNSETKMSFFIPKTLPISVQRQCNDEEVSGQILVWIGRFFLACARLWGRAELLLKWM